MTLESLREKAYFQNTIDVWIVYCEENNTSWFDIYKYIDFVHHLKSKGLNMQKFPLCIKESGGLIERGRDKARFLEELSKATGDDVNAYILKLNDETLGIVRQFNTRMDSVES